MAQNQERAVVILGLYEDFITKGVKKSEKAIDTFEANAQRPVKRLNLSFRELSGQAGSKLTAALKSSALQLVGFTAAVAAVGKGVAIFRESERALIEVATISDDVAASLVDVGDEVDRLARRYGKADTEIAKGLYQTISAGVEDVTEAFGVLDVAVGTSIAGLADTSSTVDLLTGTINAFGKQTGDAARIADAYFTAVRRGKTTIGELGASMANVTPTAAALGVSFEETLAAVTSITLSGTPTAQAVTQVAAAMNSLLGKAADVNTALRTQGSSGKGFDLVRLRTEGLVPILEDLRKTYAGNEDELRTLLGEKEAFSALLNLTGERGKSYGSVLDSIRNSTGAYSTALDRVAGTQGAFLDSLTQGASQGLKSWGEAFINAFFDEDTGTIAGLDKSEQAALRAKKAFEDMVPTIELFATILGNIAKTIEIIDNALTPSGKERLDSLQDELKYIEQIAVTLDQRVMSGRTDNAAIYRELSDSLVDLVRQSKLLAADGLIPDEEAAKWADLAADIETIGLDGLSAIEAFARGEDLEFLRKSAGAAADELNRVTDVRKSMLAFAIRARDQGAEATKAAANEQDAMTTALMGGTMSANEYATAMEKAMAAVAGYQAQLEAAAATSPAPPGWTAIEPSPKVNSSVGPGVGPFGPMPLDSGDGEHAPASLGAGMFGPLDEGQAQLEAMPESVTPIQAAFNKLAAEVEDTDARMQEFSENAIASFSFGLTDAIYGFVSGTESAKDAFGQFAASFLANISQMILQSLILKALSGGFGGDAAGADVANTSGGVGGNLFANGGIAEGGFGNMLPMKGYANGGMVATKPHIGIIGEGVHDEAIVPMPGGKALPVVLHGGGRGNAEVSINITAMDGEDAKRVLMRERHTIRDMIQDAMHRDQSFRSSMLGSVN